MEQNGAHRALLADFFSSVHGEMNSLLDALRFERAEEDWRAFAEFSRRLEDHISWEEESLFPELSAALDEPGRQAVDGLVQDHRNIGRMAASVSDSLAAGNLRTSEARLRVLRALIVRHEEKEEALLYPSCETPAGVGVAEAVVRRMAGA